jgi:hypothetical protein
MDTSMETLRLRRIQEPSRVERLLEAYVSRSVTLPHGSYQIRDSRELPQTLRSVIACATTQGETWSCWALGSHLWLFVCEMSLALSRERGAPVIVVRQYNEDANVTDSGTWRFDAMGAWTRCAD